MERARLHTGWTRVCGGPSATRLTLATDLLQEGLSPRCRELLLAFGCRQRRGLEHQVQWLTLECRDRLQGFVEGGLEGEGEDVGLGQQEDLDGARGCATVGALLGGAGVGAAAACYG